MDRSASVRIIAGEGWGKLAATGGAALLFSWFDWDFLAFLAFLALLFLLWTYRNPERLADDESPGTILAPADGTVTAIERTDSGVTVTVENGVLDVHLLRAPFRAALEKAETTRGLFLPLASTLASRLNERLFLVFSGEGQRMEVALSASGCPNPIAFYPAAGAALNPGCRIGLMTGGSCALRLEKNVELKIDVGDKLAAGQSVIGFTKGR